MANQSANFVNLSAAADAMVNGAVIVPEFQNEIVDLVKRAGVLGQRIQNVPATGAISRFFEQNDIVDGAWSNTGSFNNGGSISPTPISMVRTERSLLIKAITSQINYSLFDMETVAQQANVFAQLKAKDLKDMVNGIIRLKDKGLWAGADTVSGNQVGGGATGVTALQFVGILNQISNTTTILSAASIVDGLRTAVAKLLNSVQYNVRPTAIYMNPMAIDYLEQEAKNANSAFKFIQTNITDGVVGLSVTGLVTAAGVLPIIPEPFLQMNASVGATPIAAAPANQNNYPFVILTEELVEYHYINTPNPRVFQLGTVANLNEQYVGVMFGAPVIKAAGYAHVAGVIQR